jgi:hypothetical protein
MTGNPNQHPASIKGSPRADIRLRLPTSARSGILPISQLPISQFLTQRLLLAASRSEDFDRQQGRRPGTGLDDVRPMDRTALLVIIQQVLLIMDADEEEDEETSEL